MGRGTSIKGCCFMCGRPFEHGIRLLGRGLCHSCEIACLSTTAGDPEYDWLIARIRDGLICPAALIDAIETMPEAEGSEVGRG